MKIKMYVYVCTSTYIDICLFVCLAGSKNLTI